MVSEHRNVVIMASKRLVGYLFFAIVVLGYCPGALAATIRVPKDFPTIQKGMDSANSGDTVQVAEGIYTENVKMKEGVVLQGGWRKDFSARDIAKNTTTIDGKSKAGWVVFGANNARLDGFTIINATRTEVASGGSVGAGVHCKNTSLTIENNTITNNAPSGIYCNGSKVVIRNNKIMKNVEAGIFAENGCSLTILSNNIYNNGRGGIASGGKKESTADIRNNVIYKNLNAGIDGRTISGKVYNNLIYENEFSGVRIVRMLEVVNNTIAANIRSGISIMDPAIIPVIKNNIIANNKDTGIQGWGEGYSYNLLFANNATENCNPGYLWCVRSQYGSYGDEDSYQKHNDIIADPLFADPDKHDYHLKNGSPAIDAGDPDAKFNDANFPPSLGSVINDMGVFGGPFSIVENKVKNDPPVANAGAPQEVYVKKSAKLEGGKSYDPNGDEITYSWTLISKPSGSEAKLKTAKGNDKSEDKQDGKSDDKSDDKPEKSGKSKKPERASFKVDQPGEYVAQLVVTDRWGTPSQPSTVKILGVLNRPPTAKAGGVLSNVSVNDLVTLFGGASKDQDGDPITYKWDIVYKPEGSKAALDDPAAISPKIKLDAPGCYQLRLVVNDGKVSSKPDLVIVNTQHKAVDGKRHVPAQYPTIQSAVDAAVAGDKIIVQKGIYKETVKIEEPIDLIGVDWPTIDGGNQEGDINTVYVAYLGARAGKIEGFIITGGGRGPMGHALDLWDSASEVVNNKIINNYHNGIGVHGISELTSTCKIHNNEIYNNQTGIGNGKGSKAHIYDNDIHDNRAVAVGCRGVSTPWVDGNRLYGNFIGIGTREVGSPLIEGNYIHDNRSGIVINPISTLRTFPSTEIVIKNNLIVNNSQLGINIGSFNQTKVLIVNNTIASNNHKDKKDDRGGGLVFGFPHDGKFEAIVKNNIIANNFSAEVLNHTGSELFPAKGASVVMDHNNVWNAQNANKYVGISVGKSDISKDPIFAEVASEKDGKWYLGTGSPCIDAGGDAAAALGLDKRTSRADKSLDSAAVDLGYHYKK